MLRAAILTLPLLAPFAAVADDASQAFPADQYKAKVVMRREGTPIMTANLSPDARGRFNAEEIERRSYDGMPTATGPDPINLKNSKLRTGQAISFHVIRNGDDLVLTVKAAARKQASFDTIRTADGIVEIPSMSYCEGSRTVTAHRTKDGWRAILAMPDCGLDTEITISPNRT